MVVRQVVPPPRHDDPPHPSPQPRDLIVATPHTEHTLTGSIFVYIFPMHRMLYLGMFGFVQFWTILIHDGDMISGHLLERYINSPAHHTLHHLYFTCNYGQYFTWADKAFDSHRDPRPELDPIHASLKAMQAKGLIDEAGNPIPDVKDRKSQ